MLEQLTAVLRNYKSDDSLVVEESTTFEELGLDSLDTVQLVMELEDEFGVTIELDKSMKNVGALIEVIKAAKK
ncbi:MAG: phosphopantetheine-binding protein [Defluviitaleaceae bacterium]|nr:phosphopantetheine-binding protein [Defluviitaleaceae bacterium]